MAEIPLSLSAVSLRMADETGQATLDRIRLAGPAAAAELDQHVAAVRAGLADCQRAVDAAGSRLVPSIAAAAAMAGYCAAREHASSRPAAGPMDPAARFPAGQPALACPDAPFSGDARGSETVLALRLLLHYACGFIEAAVAADWWPGERTPIADWQSVRLAAICRLIRLAETAAALHPDLRALTW